MNINLQKDVHYEKQKAAQLFKDLQKVLKEKEMLDGEGNDCMICRENMKNIVFLPCMHVSLCQKCMDEHAFKNCPQCRVQIKEARTIYW